MDKTIQLTGKCCLQAPRLKAFAARCLKNSCSARLRYRSHDTYGRRCCWRREGRCLPSPPAGLEQVEVTPTSQAGEVGSPMA